MARNTVTVATARWRQRLRDLPLRGKLTVALVAAFSVVAVAFLLFLIPFQRAQRERLIEQERRFLTTLRQQYERNLIYDVLSHNDESLDVDLAEFARQPGVVWVRVETADTQLGATSRQDLIRSVIGREWTLVAERVGAREVALILRASQLADVITTGGQPLLESRPIAGEALPPCGVTCPAGDGVAVLTWNGEEYLHSSTPLEAGSETYGRLHVFYSLAAVGLSEAATSLLFYGLVGTTFVLLVLLLNVWIGRIVVEPVGRIVDAMREATTGDLTVRLPEHSKDEIGDIAASFNRMAGELAQSKRAIENHSRSLEERVDERTRELRESQESLLRVKNHLSAVVANVGTGVLALDDARRITTFNERAREILHPHEAVVEGRRLSDVLPPDLSAELDGFLDAATASSDEVHEGQLVLRTERGRRTLSAVASLPAGGQEREIVLVIEDLTRLLASQRLEAWKEAVERVIHEIKNPLTPVGLAAQTLRSAYAEDRDKFDQIFDSATQMILGSVRDLKALISEFTRFSRLPEIEAAATPINPLIESTLAAYAHGGPDGIRVEAELAVDLPQVHADVEQIGRVLLNVINNGIEAMEETGGVLTVTTSRNGGDAVAIRVRDEGCGVEDPERIFEPHYTTKVKGTGLGLAIARQIVEEHGGTIRADSTPGVGTTVTIELPLARA